MKISIDVIIPRNAFGDPAKLYKALEFALDASASGVQADMMRPTGNWEHKPEFRIDSKPGYRVIYTTSAIYAYVSGGTRPHPIRPRNAKRLHFFRTGFRAKSRVNSLTSNKGAMATKDETFSRGVMHPGNAARNFDITTQKRWKKLFPDEVKRAIDSAFR